MEKYPPPERTERLQRDKFYPLADRHPAQKIGPMTSIGYLPMQNIAAKWNGEKRCPKKGEWYLSGARIAAYRAPNDLSSEYHIANIYQIETKRITERKIIKWLGNK